MIRIALLHGSKKSQNITGGQPPYRTYDKIPEPVNRCKVGDEYRSGTTNEGSCNHREVIRTP